MTYEALGIAVGHDADGGVVIDDERGIDQLAIDAPGERGTREP